MEWMTLRRCELTKCCIERTKKRGGLFMRGATHFASIKGTNISQKQKKNGRKSPVILEDLAFELRL